jgi:hypothetical protein
MHADTHSSVVKEKSSISFLTATGLKVILFAATQIFTIPQITLDGKDVETE